MSARPVDPFAPGATGYVDDLVEVRALGRLRPRRTLGMVRTEHFDVTHVDSRVRVDHRIPPEALHGGLAGVLAAELFGPGWLRGPELFARILTGIVLTSAADPMTGWELFYRNTLDRVEARISGRTPTAVDTEVTSLDAHCSIAGYAPVYGHAEELLAPGSVLELGSCFGFLSLRLAARGRAVTALDVSPGTVRLLGRMADRLGTPIRTITADAAQVPAPPRTADTVLALHLLEHLDAEHGQRVLREAVRLAGRRVVVAVPLEDEPEETWGHVRTVTLDDLTAWGRELGLPFDVHEFHGGWLTIDTA